MDQKGEENTDEPQQPVASLRSRFENLGVSKGPPPATPAKSPSIGAQSRFNKLDEPSPRSDGRMSLDIPREPYKPGPPSPLKGPTSIFQRKNEQANSSKPRPISMGPTSPPRSPPRVTVTPMSPPKNPQPRQPSPMSLSRATPKPSPLLGASDSPPMNGNRHSRVPSRSTTPGIEAIQATLLQSSSPQTIQTDPRKAPTNIADASVPKQTPQLGPPPPINRAGKPKTFPKPAGLSAPVEKPRQASLTAPESVDGDDRVSPFSTPPSSDEPAEVTPPVIPLASKPKTEAPVIPRDSYFPKQTPSPTPAPAPVPAPAQHPSSSRRPAPQPPPPPQPPPTKRINTAPIPHLESDAPDDRPGLPPRRDPGPPDPPPVRRSIDVPRSSIDAQRRLSAVPPDPSRFAPPPKRGAIPASHAIPTHGRTPIPAARAISRASLEMPRDTQPNNYGGYQYDSDDIDSPMDQTGPSLTEFPDSTQANRRPPYLKGPEHIPTGYDTRLFAACGEYVCTSGYFTRVWNVLTGELLMSLSHGDTTKMTALAFKPASNVEDEGKRLWIGSNMGEIHEVDIPTQSIVVTKSNAHPRREIVKIYRYSSEMWSLDDDGKLHLWPSDESGTPSLRQAPNIFHLPKGHSFSLIAGTELWVATGKNIWIFQRNSATNSPQQVFAQALNQKGVGDITSGAIISSQPDKIYFGHSDGKVTVYSRETYACLEVVPISTYKISCLQGVGDYLWVSFLTGMIYVYDTSFSPWTVKKDWRAHSKPVAGMVLDRTSLWKLDRLQVVSLGLDNMIKFWDGMLAADWLDSRMQDRDTEYCDFREITSLVMTWNAGAVKPSALRGNDAGFFEDLLGTHADNPPDILVFGFQELVDLEDKKVTAKSFFKSRKKNESSSAEHMSHQYRAWRDALTKAVDQNFGMATPYTLLHTANLVGLFTCIFIKSSERYNIRDISAAEIKLGMGGLHGNKGALIVRFMLDDTSLCFINCHLAAGQSHTSDRNNNFANIMEAAALPPHPNPVARVDYFPGGGDGSMVLDHEVCILNGDLNYRIDAMPRDMVIKHVEQGNLPKLFERDQLHRSREKNPNSCLRAFKENPITFAPTYKYDVGTDRYDTSEKKRAPAWCDRLLYRGRGRIKMDWYGRHEVRVSDHRPVSGGFRMRVKVVDQDRKEAVRAIAEQEYEEWAKRVGGDVKLDYLCNVFGLSAKEAQNLLKK